MSNSHPLPPKKEVALALLERSNDRGIFVHLDPRQAAVVVPPWFKKQPQLVLQIGLNMPVPIPDLRLDDDGMSCTLSFNRSPFFCVVPWASVFAMVGEDGRGMVWPDDVPAEVPLSRQTSQERAGERGAERPAPPSMRALDGAKRDAKPASSRRGEDAEGEGTAKAKRPRKRPPLAAVPDGESKAGGAGGSATASGNGPKKKTPRAERSQPASARPLGAAPLGAAQKRGSSAGAGKPAAVPSRGGKKRELPPYLRVVK